MAHPLRLEYDNAVYHVTSRGNERIHAAVRKYQYRLKEVGDHLGLCYSTISVIAKRVDESGKP